MTHSEFHALAQSLPDIEEYYCLCNFVAPKDTPNSYNRVRCWLRWKLIRLMSPDNPFRRWVRWRLIRLIAWL